MAASAAFFILLFQRRPKNHLYYLTISCTLRFHHGVFRIRSWWLQSERALASAAPPSKCRPNRATSGTCGGRCATPTTFDANDNSTGQIGSLPTLSWIGNASRVGSVESFKLLLIELAQNSYSAFIGGSASGENNWRTSSSPKSTIFVLEDETIFTLCALAGRVYTYCDLLTQSDNSMTLAR